MNKTPEKQFVSKGDFKERLLTFLLGEKVPTPPSDSLVRPATPFMLPDEAKTVLLRATTGETPEESRQLLRVGNMEDSRNFKFQVEGAVSVGGRFTTLWGTLLEGTMQSHDYLILPAKDGGQLLTIIVDIAVSDKWHPNPVTGRQEFVAMRTWGPVIPPDKIQLMGIATRSAFSCVNGVTILQDVSG